MSLAISADHTELAATVRRWVESRAPIATARVALESEADEVPSFWAELADLGWIGLAVSEANGGSGYGLAELAIVLEELGAGCVPGPFLPTAAVAAIVDRWGGAPDVVAALVDGSRTAGVGLRPGGPVWSGGTADVVVVPIVVGADWDWVLLDASDCEVTRLDSFDRTRRLARVVPPGPAHIDTSRRLDCDRGAPVGLVALLASAESVGISDWCVRTAAAYAQDRVQFGRPIGQFQAVKHRCADMMVAAEAARALVWDAARSFDGEDEGWKVALDAAASRAPDTAFRCAQDCIQTLGGIGYTWEHDAHLFLKRATATSHLLPAPSVWRLGLTSLVRAGERRPVAIDLGDEADPIRERVDTFVAELQSHPRSEWNRRVAEAGYLVPHWPRPYGLEASPIEQLVIDERFAAAKVRRPHLQVAAWVLPTIIAHGSAQQQERWVLPSLRQEIMWCQMFSEPGAGSDLASLTTRATKVDGGWSITGQKVWTSMAQWAQWAICLARTDPAAPKHEGIGCFMVDMSSAGLDIRPLRELTGMEMFNEVFLTDVFVPDDCLVGGPTGGWEAARTTLANERVSMASGSSFGPGTQALFDLAAERHLEGDVLLNDTLGGLVATSHAVAMLGVRTTLRALGGAQPGPEASVRKLLGVTHEQQVQEVGLAMLGPDAAVADGPGAAWTAGFLGNRALSIAGGTSEIQRNVIAERLLGLPKDP